MPNNKHGDPTVVMAFTSTAATSASGSILAANEDRRYALVINHATTELWLLIGSSTAAATVNGGIRLAAAGGQHDKFEMSAAKGNLDTRAIYAIANSSGSKTVVVVECT